MSKRRKVQGQTRKVASFISLLISLGVLIAAGWIFLNRQYVIDQITIWRNPPASSIVQLADESFLNERGRFYLYASRPEVNDRGTFNTNCTHRGEQTVVLGCYAGQRIYIFRVEDERLKGIEQVTTAHEMLHAVYERLSPQEKERVNGLIELWYPRIADERLKNIIKVYDKTEPGERLNELHSILATEVRLLSPELEAYYSQYFTDRLGVVKLSEGYEKVFQDLKDQQVVLVAELKTLSEQIAQRIETYNADIAQLNSDVSTFNDRARNGEFASQTAFVAERSGLVQRQDDLNDERESINAQIALYNTKRTQLEAINGQAESLNQSINSLSPVPSVQ